jgi:hypothetical protein
MISMTQYGFIANFELSRPERDRLAFYATWSQQPIPYQKYQRTVPSTILPGKWPRLQLLTPLLPLTLNNRQISKQSEIYDRAMFQVVS